MGSILFRKLLTSVNFLKQHEKTMNEILNAFRDWSPPLVEAMEACDHAYSTEHLNPWHLEGSVWAHTIMVYDAAQVHRFDVSEHTIEILQIAAMCHDIGKLYTRKENQEKKRVSFFNHEAFSIQPAMDFLTYLSFDYFKPTVCKLIAYHMQAHKCESSEDLLKLAGYDEVLAKRLKIFNRMDGDGRVSELKVEQRF